ncbi:MAG: PHP domain-containing protein [Eubacteriales bacterium]|nr:PHP domain-containing protein [Eubacteriales bacterium]
MAREIDINMGKKVDLHMHSTFSDGTYTPTELVKMRADEGYDVVAITDHDGTGGVPEALDAGKKYGVTVVPGMELGTVYRGQSEIHLLGYDFDINDEFICNKLKEIEVYRNARNRRLLGVFQEMGYDIKAEDLVRHPGQRYIAKPDFAWVFVNRGYVKDVSEAFRSPKFLANSKAARQKQMKVDVEDAIRFINKAGGKCVVAHPMKIRGQGEKGSEEFFVNLEEMLKNLKEAGLYGLECYHPSASEEDSKRLEEIAARLDLRVTKGSDYHGPQTKQRG